MAVDGNWADRIRTEAKELIDKGEYKQAAILYLQIEQGSSAQALATLHLAEVIRKKG
jgi:hypothetical protein